MASCWDIRGYSGNPGKPSEQGLYQDARSALNYLHAEHVPGPCIVLYGESIGAAVAIQMATEFRIGALILQAPSTSLPAIGQFHYPFLPVKWFLKDKYDSIAKTYLIQVPSLVLIGEKDDIVPSKLSIQLYQALPAPKQNGDLSNIGHNDLFEPDHAIHFIKKYVHCDQNSKTH